MNEASNPIAPIPGDDSSDQPMPVGPMLAFVAVWLCGSLLVVSAIVYPVIPGRWLTVVVVNGCLLLTALAIVQAFSGAFYPTAFVRRIVFRPFWYMMLFAPIVALSALGGLLVGLLFGAARPVGMWAAAAATGVLLLGAVAGWFGSRKLTVKTLRVQLPNLPPAFSGLRVVQISDLHVGPHTSPRFLAAVSQAVQSAKPDLLAITGDQVDDFADDVRLFGNAFGKLTARYGVYAIAGNHDVYAGWNGVRAGIKDLGFSVLVNEAAPIEIGDERIWIAGTGDPAGNQWKRRGGTSAAPDLDRTLASVPAGEFVLVLAHNPDLWQGLAEQGADLTLSGHTHYGQFAIPSLNWNAAGMFVSPSMGVHRYQGSLLYINPGTNFWGIPFRLGAPPEVTVLELQSVDSAMDASIHIVGVQSCQLRNR